MKWLTVGMMLAAGAAAAESVGVKSGDHADFTRLVLTFPDTADWQLNRTERGYEFQRTDRKETFDLSDVYRLITKDRLKSIWVDPASVRLQMGIDCLCHAIPFEFNENTLVIDIRNGPPPAGSVFEQSAVDGKTLPPLRQATVRAERSQVMTTPVYNWLDKPSIKSAVAHGTDDQPRSVPQSDFHAESQSDGVRKAVIDQLAKGATEGVIEISPEGLGPVSDVENVPDLSNVRVATGSEQTLPLGIVVSDGSEMSPLAENGEICPTEDRVDPSLWSVADASVVALTNSRNGILGEFDQPSPKGILAAVRTHLFLGFGAEARNILAAFQPTAEVDALAIGISYLVDGEQPLGAPFAGMQTCDSGAAFWALAASLPDDNLIALNGIAVARTFMGLPLHLKRVFAQKTVDGLMRVGDVQNAEIVRASLTRAVSDTGGLVPLVDAEMALYANEPQKAEALLEAVSDSGLASGALMALVEARFQQMTPVEEKDVIALEAFAVDYKGGVHETVYRKAMTHAYSLAGDFPAAFVAAGTDTALRNDIWGIMATLGQTNDLLYHAVGSAKKPEGPVSPATKAAFVRRFVELGLPNTALDWLPSSPEDLILTAEVALANADGRTALRALSKDMPDKNPKLLASALEATGSYAQAAAVLRDAGDTEHAQRLERWVGIWPVDADSSDPAESNAAWHDLATLRAPDQSSDTKPPLEASQSLLDGSAITRQKISNLLQTVPAVTQ